MLRAFVLITVAAAMLYGDVPRALAADDDDSRLILQVLREEDKKPVASAHVVIRFIAGRNGKALFLKKKRTSWEAQTNRRGELVLDDIPMGQVKIQIIAKGFQTYGQDVELTKPEEQLTITLKPPAGQVSAY
jgi:hypothetical protein